MPIAGAAACRAASHGLRFHRSRLLRARAPRVREAVRCHRQRRLRHRGDQVHRPGQPAACREGETAGGCVLVERAGPHAGAQVARRAGVVQVAERPGHSCRPRRLRWLLDRLLSANSRDCLQHEAGQARRGASFGVRPGRSQVARPGGNRRPSLRLDLVSRRGAVRACRRREGGRLLSTAESQRCPRRGWQLRRPGSRRARRGQSRA